MGRTTVGVVGALLLAGCAGSSVQPVARAADRSGVVAAAARGDEGTKANGDPAGVASNEEHPRVRPVSGSRDPGGPWVGAAPESDMLPAMGGSSVLGVWVDVPPSLRSRVRAPVDLAIVIDTSGSMEGAKVQAARDSARAVINRLVDGDMVSIDAFDDTARVLLAPTMISPATRERALATVAELRADGSTNLAEGLRLGESQLASAPAGIPVRRMVLISDGRANVGMSSTAALGEIAAQSLRFGAQITSLGVGLDYDEATLDTIAERTSGRLFHVGDPKEMRATLDHEMDLLASTVASEAVLEVVPAPGVKLVGVEGAHGQWMGANAEIALGALFPGQHREALVRVVLDGSAVGIQRTLASVRLKYHDPTEGGVERVQEVLARASVSDDSAAIAAHANAKTHAMMATLEASKVEIEAAQALTSGNFAQAQAELARVEDSLTAQVAAAKDDDAKARLQAVRQSVAASKVSAAHAPMAAPSAVRGDALEMNKAGMGLSGL